MLAELLQSAAAVPISALECAALRTATVIWKIDMISTETKRERISLGVAIASIVVLLWLVKLLYTIGLLPAEHRAWLGTMVQHRRYGWACCALAQIHPFQPAGSDYSAVAFAKS
ncbi:MAG: hypothetical protein AA908_08420 [Chlorobi bacterium NICIL-2]|nr:MAG: hypothetical protein AA908_08420 [Chlorobi bacterium NICIL-2]